MRVISGVQPTGILHLGNYFGAIREHVEWQEKAESYFLVADLHALTTQHDGRRLRENTRDAAIVYLACGLDPTKCALYRQSDVPEVCELSWILTTVTPMGELQRATAYKEALQNNESCQAGVLNYPILMAADILLVGATIVPVGRDQQQHIEIVREIVRRFNVQYQTNEPIFSLPEACLSRTPFVPGVNGEKMSKRYGNTIGILDESEELTKKVNSIATEPKTRYEPKDPEKCTVFYLLSMILTESETSRLAQRYRSGEIDYSEAKEMLTEKLDAHFRDIRAKYKQLSACPELVEKILAEGADRARQKASAVLTEVRHVTGLRGS